MEWEQKYALLDLYDMNIDEVWTHAQYKRKDIKKRANENIWEKNKK